MPIETPADVAAVREEYEARILGLHMPAVVRQAAERYGDAPAFSDRFDVPEGSTWSTISWAETWARTQQVAAALNRETARPVATLHYEGLALTGCDHHPDLADHRALADRLAGAIARIDGLWN